MTHGPRRLTLVRHAKSSWADPDVADHERPLNRRGRRAAIAVGRRLRETGVEPELVLCSTAKRARETLELLELTAPGEVRFEDRLYGADADSLLARLRTIATTIGSVLLLGHNPGIEELARMLDEDGLAGTGGFPTAAVADLRLPIRTWAQLQPGIGQLHAFVIPRDLD